MRRSLILLFIAAVFCAPLSFALAQGGEGAEIATSIDQSASEDGLPMGDGKVSTVEQEIGSEISRQMNAHEGVFAELDGITDPRYAAIHGSQLWYDEYHKALEQRGLTDKVDKLDRGEDVEAVDPGNTELKENVEKIDSYTQEQGAKGKFDPRASAISGAVAQYGLPPPGGKPITKQQVVETVRKGTNRAIDRAKLKYKNLTKRYINKILNRILTEKEDDSLLPLNGYWRAQPYSMKVSGKCAAEGVGDNGGMGAYDTSNDPGQPLCGFRNPGGLPFFTYNSGTHVYEPDTASIYSAGSRTRYEVRYDSAGASVGTVNITSTLRYQVVSPTEVHVLVTIQEKDGCTMTADYLLELVKADSSMCAPSQPLPTTIPTEPSSTGTQPTPEGPVKSEGPFKAGSPIFTDKKQCDDKNTPPQMSEIHIRPQSENTLLIDYGTGTQVVYRSGENTYMYQSGAGSKLFISISLTLLEDGSASIFWSIADHSGKQCSFSQTFELPASQPTANGTPAAEATPVSETAPDDGNTGSAGSTSRVGSLAAGHYTVKWTVMDAMCPAEMKAVAPSFTEATLSFPDSTTAVVTFAGGEYTLVDSIGQGIYMLGDGKQDNLRYVATLSPKPDGGGFFTWVGSLNNNFSVTCTAMADLTQS